MATGLKIATSGITAEGVVVSSGGVATLNGGSVSTSGDYANGLHATGVGSSITTLSGTTVSTAGLNPYGMQADTCGQVILNGGSVATSGVAAFGLSEGFAGSSITTYGTKVTTSGTNANGAEAYLGTVTLNGGSIAASGASAVGLFAIDGGGSVTSNGTTISASGPYAVGVLTDTGGHVTLNGGSVTMSGVGAMALVDSLPGFPITANNVAINTSGAASSGAVTEGGGVTNLSGGSVNTAGQDAHALVVNGSGSRANLSGTGTFATQGDGAIGLYVSNEGVLAATGQATISTAGVGAFGVDADGQGSQIKLGSATIATSGAGATGLFASDATSSGSAGSITATGTLNVTTTNAAAAAVALQGDGASVVATGGGSIVSAGDAIEFLGGNNQTATFDNFNIANRTGDLIYAGPSVATVNFTGTVANAGNGALLDATGGSFVTLNASASTPTGTIQTDAASTTTVNLTSGSTWTMTGPSTVSNLAVTNSVVVFAPPTSGAGFKTLTLTNYVSSPGANITMNVALGGAGSASDQIVINGGKATASTMPTMLTIHNAGGAGGQTAGLGIPLVIAVNGGTTDPNAFALANTPVVGGYRYTLQEFGEDWYLVSAPTATPSDIANSVTSVAKAIQQQIITGRVLTSILLGATEQVNCSNCSSGFGSIGSYALGAHGRWSLTDEVTLMGGFSYDEYSASGITVTNAPTFAGSVVYDPVNFGHSLVDLEPGEFRRFVAGGGWRRWRRRRRRTAWRNLRAARRCWPRRRARNSRTAARTPCCRRCIRQC